jgi:hypothetical protein
LAPASGFGPLLSSLRGKDSALNYTGIDYSLDRSILNITRLADMG